MRAPARASSAFAAASAPQPS
eukprot:COSAG01_NODE_23847_length_799_cov_2.745714_1_plen_20_part_10